MAKDDESFSSILKKMVNPAQPQLERYHSDWDMVDLFTIDQATYLWCGYEPSRTVLPPSGDKLPKNFTAVSQMLMSVAQADAIKRTNNLYHPVVTGRHTISRERLMQLAEEKKTYPAFLFDVIASTVDEEQEKDKETSASEKIDEPQEPTRKGRPPEYNWDLMVAEVIRYAALHDLPASQAELTRHLENWFRNGMSNRPSTKDHGGPGESTLKRKVSAIYANLDKAGWKPAGS